MLDLKDLVKQYGQYKEVPSNPYEFRFCCPYCVEIGKAPDRKFHLYINIKLGLGYCFRCNKKLVFRNGYKKRKLIDFSDYITEKKPFSIERDIDVISIFDYPKALDFVYYKYPNYSKDYLNEFLQFFNIGVCLDERYSFLYERIAIPIVFNKEIVGYQFRTIYDEEPKYLSFTFRDCNSVKSYVFNFDNLKENIPVYITEGVFDLLPFKPWNNVVCVFGKNLTKIQVSLLLTKTFEFILCFDADAIKDAINVMTELMSYGCNVSILELPDDKDPAEIGFDIFKLSKKSFEEVFCGGMLW